MITSRATRLVRVPDLQAMRLAVSTLASATDLTVRQTAVLVPTASAGEELRRSLETAAVRDGSRARLMPDFVTRASFYRVLHAAMRRAPRLLTDPEREVLLRRAARDVIVSGTPPPFRLRPGLIVQMLDFYDELRRREQTLDDFERHTIGRLEDSAAIDRGAERLLQQTRFLCAAFSAFERLVHDTAAIDEHGLRMLLLADGVRQQVYRHVIVTVADQAADSRGLYASDFDLLTRIDGLERIDLIATEGLLASGFHERVHQLLPEIEEQRFGPGASAPVLIAPETVDPDQRWFSWRDREEELVGFVRALKARAASPHDSIQPPPLDRMAVVFRRRLPYLYLARQVFADGGIPYEAADALPLSAEPFAATMDVVFSVLTSEGNRTSIVELLSSPHLQFAADLGQREIAALDARLRDAKYAGGWDRLLRLAERAAADVTPGAEALRRAWGAAKQLRMAFEEGTASAQITGLMRFVREFEHLPTSRAGAWTERHLRARAAVLATLHALCEAHARHDDRRLDAADLAGAVRRWIDAQTFAPRIGSDGVRLLDAVAAAYADLDELHMVGLAERDWPEPPQRNIFYPGSMLAALGWPADAARLGAARAAFHDLLASPRRRVSVSVFTLEDDTIVPPSPLLEELDAAGLEIERWPAPPPANVFIHEAVQRAWLGEVASASPPAAEWLALRTSRSAPDERFRGATGARAAQSYAVSYLERYLECPFKYFAARVLRLPEERDEESGLSPLERGHFVHLVFETFFREWQQSGRGAITTANVADALILFESVAERRLEELPEADRALERTHLLGSAAASGLAERAFAFEIEQGGQVLERLLEHEIEGEFTFNGADGPRRVTIKAKADRLDLMADGTIRVIDYKLSKAPKAARALQLPIYGVMAEQALDGYLGRRWTTATAGYIAFKEREPFVPLGGGKGNGIAAAVAEGQQRLVAAVEAIERGEFPVQPDEPFRCQWCGYAGVCRKDYVGDE